jgi:midasin
MKQLDEKKNSLKNYWELFNESLLKFHHQQHLIKNSFAFSFVEGTLVKALKQGDWVLLDEMNLASQSVLEGLNSVLDHRKEIYIPEINETIE